MAGFQGSLSDGALAPEEKTGRILKPIYRARQSRRLIPISFQLFMMNQSPTFRPGRAASGIIAQGAVNPPEGSGAAAPGGSIPAPAIHSPERIAQFGAVPCASCRPKTRRVLGKKRLPCGKTSFFRSQAPRGYGPGAYPSVEKLACSRLPPGWRQRPKAPGGPGLEIKGSKWGKGRGAAGLPMSNRV